MGTPYHIHRLTTGEVYQEVQCAAVGIFRNAQNYDMMQVWGADAMWHEITDGWVLTNLEVMADGTQLVWTDDVCPIDGPLQAMCLHTGDWRAVAEQESSNFVGLNKVREIRASMTNQAMSYLARNVPDDAIRGRIEALLPDIILLQLYYDGWVVFG